MRQDRERSKSRGSKAANTVTLLTVLSASLATLGAGAPAAWSSPNPDPSSVSPRLQQLATLANREAKATFKITYAMKGDHGPEPWRYTLGQKLPRQLFRADGPARQKLIADGKKTSYCKLDTSPIRCVVFSSASSLFSSGLAMYPSLEAEGFQLSASVFSPDYFVSTLKGWARSFAAGTGGYNVSFSKTTFAGQPSQCVSVLRLSRTGRSGGTKYCVTNKGIMAYVGGLGAASGSSHSLVSYSAHVNDSDFSLPIGANVTALKAIP
jgi:hypothetical protein